MKSRRGFFSALALAVSGSGTAAVAGTSHQTSKRLLEVGMKCECGSPMLHESVNSAEVARCCSPECKHYRKRFQRPTVELRQVGHFSVAEQRQRQDEFDKRLYGVVLGPPY